MQLEVESANPQSKHRSTKKIQIPGTKIQSLKTKLYEIFDSQELKTASGD